MLQALRDEAHRFAITYHRQLREKRISSSLLDEVPGIGPVRKRELLRSFRSVQAIADADVAEICTKVPGIGSATAEKLIAYLRRGK